MITALPGAVRDGEKDRMQSAPWSKGPLTRQRKEAVLRALSDLEALKRKEDEPEVAHEVITHHLDLCTLGHRMPPLISGFLETHWHPYMAQLYLVEGEGSEAWRGALENTENLIRSVQPKGDDESRQELYDILPELFQWVHSVLASRQVAVPDEDAFFAALSRLHVDSLHSGEQRLTRSLPGVEMAPVATGVSAAQCDNTRDHLADISDVPEPDLLQPEIKQVSEATDSESNPLRDLVIGASVEFQSERATKRVLCLEWISGRGGVFLFRDESRGDALCLTADRCIQCLREGSASILS